MMMKTQSKQQDYIMMTMDDIVPQDHLLRKIDKHVDFSFIHDVTKPLYSALGRSSVDPINIFKIELLNILYGYNSIRRTCKAIQTDVSYRWFLNIPFTEATPHFSTLSKVYSRKFEENEVYEKIFLEVMHQLKAKDLLNTTQIYIDGTHIKAHANKKKWIDVEIDKEPHAFEEEILAKINETRKNDGMKPVEPVRETKVIKQSTTDPECGYYVKGEREKQMAYVAQVVCDEHGYALDVEVVPGNVHDSQAAKPILERVLKNYPVSAVAADAGYKTGPIAEFVLSHHALFFTSYTRPKTKAGFFKSYEFVYDEYTGDVICPNHKLLRYQRTIKEGYKLYRAKASDCGRCPLKDQCTTQPYKEIRLSVFHDVLEYVEELRHTDYGRETYQKRKEKIERLFADAKENHGMRYTRFTGRKRVRNHLLLTLACMNIKKMATHLERIEEYEAQ